MKKTLLIGAAIAVGFSAFAQGTRQAANLKSKTLNKGMHKIDAEAFPIAGTKNLSGPKANQTSAVCTPAAFTSASNAYGVGGGVTTFQQNCLSYNKDLNSYVVVHRRSPYWAFSANTSGAMEANWINMGTGVWDSTIVYRDSLNTAPGRYPSGTFYNPAGNNSIANAWVVGSGPALPGGGFTGPWWNARKLTGTTQDQSVHPSYVSTPIQNTNYGIAPSAPFGTAIFLNVDMQQVGTKVFVTGESTDTTTSANANHNTAHGVNIVKADFSGGGNPVWSKDSVLPGFYFNRNGAGNGYASSYGDGARLAFDATGTTGYLVFFGRLATTCSNSADSAFSPIVYKTTNGGTSWAPILSCYDWSCKHPELGKNVGTLFTTKPKHFQPHVNHGIDLTVDANGKLHLVTTFVTPFSDGASPDSLIWNYTYNWDYMNAHPVMWDLMTDGTDWKTMMIDSLVTSYVGGDAASDTTAAGNSVDDGSGGKLPYGARLQVARSSDGTKVFYSWADSDPTITGTQYNSQPDLWMKAYDVNTGMTSVSSNITNGIGTCFFHNMADQAYFDAGTSKWKVPMVYSLPSAQTGGIYSSLSQTFKYWVDCAAYGTADYTMTGVINSESTTTCAIGVQTFGNFFNAVNAFPNPFSGSTKIVVNLNEAKNISVNVFDAIGNLVSTKKVNGNIGENSILFDGSSLTAGVYYYTVTAGYEKVTKKLVIQK